ncbi:glycosyltransferase family 4 protein [Microtetraspora malaysiensis]|uniref:Glycosyltransferase family 4 protein n=1 Tax=Microtetraspora malaysiensis TaxID=161358 RepID=A0ABW6T2V3_9ACTN
MTTAITVDTAVLFYPRGGSAQVIRYLLRELNSRAWRTRLHAGSLGSPSDPSHAPTFYKGLDLHPFDYNTAQAAFERGQNPQGVALPFHPSYEDRGYCPDPMFSAVPPATATHLTRAWQEHLVNHRSPDAELLHLHHLSQVQTAARHAYPAVPTVTTLHGTELKLMDGMRQRIRLANRIGGSLEELAHELSSNNPMRRRIADRLATRAALDDDDATMLLATPWEKWRHSLYWLPAMNDAAVQAGTIVTVSEHDHDLARTLLPLRQHHVPVVTNGVDTEQFRPQPMTDVERAAHLHRWLVTDPRGWCPGGKVGSIRYTDADLRRLYDIHGRLRPLLLWVGRFLDFKRVPVLLEAFAQARKICEPAPVLLMWGGYPGECEGAHPADLAHALNIDDDVFFLGWRGHDELPAGLNCADLMVAPAVNEPFGMVYIEAMACGTPPIATATGGPARIITSSGASANGWTVRPNNAADLAGTLIYALTYRGDRARRARNAHLHAHATYSWRTVADRYTEVYEQAASLHRI